VTEAFNAAQPEHGPRIWATFTRFLLSGAFNTAVTYAMYLVLLRFMSYRVSYTIAFVSGIIIAYCLNRVFVFRASGGAKAVALFPLVYVVQYAAGLAIVSIWVEILGWSSLLAPAAAIAFTIPLTFFLTRLVFTGKGFSGK